MIRVEDNEQEKGASGKEMNQEYENLCNSIISHTTKNGMNVVGITSTKEAEGCTTIATTIAYTMAKRGRSVLLMDGNFRDPFLNELFQTSNENGLKEIMRGEVDVDTAIKNTILPHLKIIAVGNGLIEPSAVYSSTKFIKILDHLKSDSILLL